MPIERRKYKPERVNIDTLKKVDRQTLIDQRLSSESEEIRTMLNQTIENYKKLNGSINPTEFANSLNVQVVTCNLDKCDKNLGILVVAETTNTNFILINEKIPQKDQDYIIAYETSRYLVEQHLDLLGADVHEYSQQEHSFHNMGNKANSLCHEMAQKILT